MSIIFLLAVVGILVAGGFLFAFIWAVKSGQYEDSYSPSVRVLFDDHIEVPETEPSKNENTNPTKDNKNNNTD
ncbi:MAG: cbb3-type cytochrome oxidase assembly protein CcoS [Chlorobi bacterium]|nr:cbb3-type cytochrome oxidase assembly protein CcoS [Chlorobiota bacterium]